MHRLVNLCQSLLLISSASLNAIFVVNHVTDLMPKNLMSFKIFLQLFLFSITCFSSFLLPPSQLFLDVLLPLFIQSLHSWLRHQHRPSIKNVSFFNLTCCYLFINLLGWTLFIAYKWNCDCCLFTSAAAACDVFVIFLFTLTVFQSHFGHILMIVLITICKQLTLTVKIQEQDAVENCLSSMV